MLDDHGSKARLSRQSPFAAIGQWVRDFALGDIPCGDCIRYLMAAAVVGGAYAVREAMQPLFGLDRAIYPFFYFASVMIAFVIGTRPALLASVFMGALAYWRFAAPAYSFEMKPVALVSLAVYAASVFANIWFIHAFKELLSENRVARRQAENMAEGHAALFREFNDSAAIYFQLVSALMSTQSIERDEASYEKALLEISRHTMQISRLHRSLENIQKPNTDIVAFVRHMLHNAIEMAGASKIQIAMSGGSMILPTSEATSIAVVLMEVSRLLIDYRPQSIIFDVEVERDRRVLRLTAHVDDELAPLPSLSRLAERFVDSVVGQIGGKLHWYRDKQNIIAELAFPGEEAIFLEDDLIGGVSGMTRATLH